MEKVIFSKIGQGLTILNSENLIDFIEPAPFVLAGQELIPGEYYTLNGFFKIPIEYSGLLKNEISKYLCFYLGEEDGIKYYTVYAFINEIRIFKKFTETSGRDFNYKNGFWK